MIRFERRGELAHVSRSRAGLRAAVAVCAVTVASGLSGIAAPLEEGETDALVRAPGVQAFSAETIAPGVHVFRPNSPSWDRTNSVVIERDDGLLVVDAQPTPASARALLASIEATVPGSIRYLVFSHPHVAATGGARAFPEGTLRIASRGFRDAVLDREFDYLAELGGHAELRDLDAIRPFPTLVLFARTRLEDARNPVVLQPVPHAHSPGDLTVLLPESGIAVAGDVAYTTASLYAGDAEIKGWVAQLNNLINMSPRAVVPSRGETLDLPGVKRCRDGIAWVRNEVLTAFSDGVPGDEVVDHVMRSGRASRFFEPRARDVLHDLVSRSVEEEREKRRRSGLE